ncbi:MAG TPA: hypothetical protein VMU14_06605, partial [Acidimicrobiales bacterium]|nr:hypothetical protein [Acidimicrobiales bacterium]
MSTDTLERMRAAADRVRANLVDLEHDPHRQLLDSAPLTGETAARWAAGRAALEELWAWFVRLTEVLDRAEAVHGPHRH